MLLSSCSSPIQRPSPVDEVVRLQVVPKGEWPVLSDDLDSSSLEMAVLQSLKYHKNRPRGDKLRFGSEEISRQEIVEGLRLFLDILTTDSDRASKNHRIRDAFELYRLVRDREPLPILLTGYYEPTLYGSRRPTPRFQYPVYRLPGDLLLIDPQKFSKPFEGRNWVGRLKGNRVIPYYSRQEIDQGGELAGKNLELLWVDDPLKLFFMHIQGSGQVLLDDGSLIKLGYGGTNGHPYFPIGKELVRRGLFQPGELSLQVIYDFLQKNPQEREKVMNLNRSYIFFREVPGGPYGSLGFPLTPGRSIAADFAFFPPGALAWLTGMKPNGDSPGPIQSWGPLGRWVTVQDSGGAIKGPSRVDLFWGSGPEAEMAAGHLRHPGNIFLLLKK
jgi:membrane-bound lytic murein transglycosylase A